MDPEHGKVARWFTPASFEGFASEYAHSPLLAALVKNFGDRSNVLAAFQYGMATMTDTADLDLGSYFFLLSELRDQHQVITDFAIDASLHCDDPEIAPVRLEDLRAVYEKVVKPLLKNGSTT